MFTNILLGFITGILSCLFGVGGGFIIVPGLYLSNMNLHTAISSSLLYVTVIGFFGTINHLRNNNIIFKVGLPASFAAIFSVQLGIYLYYLLPAKNLKFIFIFIMIIASLRHLKKAFSKKGKDEVISTYIDQKRVILSFGVGLVSGTLSGLLGIGGGIIIVPLLYFLIKLPLKSTIATSMFIITFTGLSGTVNHIIHNNVNLSNIIPLIIAGILGTQIGIRLFNFSSEKYLNIGFSILILVSCSLMYMK